MAKSIDPHLMKIGEYLQLEEDVVFNIPAYQRPYSWTTSQCDKLWQDIVDYANESITDKYFFGTVIVNCQNEDRKLDLIDGQQRTTTFLLLLKALLVKINAAILNTPNDEDSGMLYRGLKARRSNIMKILYKAEPEEIPEIPDGMVDSAIYQRVSILENESINESYKEELNTILQAADYASAEQSVLKLKYKQKDNKYTNFFRNYKFFYNKIGELSDSKINSIAKTIIDKCEIIEIKSWDVEQAINMFNSLNSDGLPLDDADIISAKLYSAANAQGKNDEYKTLWEDLQAQIADSSSMNIDSILMQYMYYTRAKNREIISDSGTINVTTPGLRRYFTALNKDILNYPIMICEDLINLVKVWKVVATYPFAQVLFKLNENSRLFLASYFLRYKAEEVTPDLVKPVFLCFLRLFILLELVDIGYSSSLFKTFLFGEAVKLVNTSVSVDEISHDFTAHINSKWDRETIEKELSEYDGNALVFVNEYLFAEGNNVQFTLDSKYDIEHIMPNSGKDLQTIRADADMVDEDEFSAYVNKLGNKILLEERINRAIGNEWFSTKVSTKLENKTGYVDSKFPIASFLVDKYRSSSKPYWKKEDIMSATNEASKRITTFIFGE